MSTYVKALVTYCDIEHKVFQKVVERSGLVSTSIMKEKYENPNQNGKAIDCINYRYNQLYPMKSGTEHIVQTHSTAAVHRSPLR